MEPVVQNSSSEESISNDIMYHNGQPKNLEPASKSPVISVSNKEPESTAISSVTSDNNAICDENIEHRLQEQQNELTDHDSTVVIDR